MALPKIKAGKVSPGVIERVNAEKIVIASLIPRPAGVIVISIEKLEMDTRNKQLMKVTSIPKTWNERYSIYALIILKIIERMAVTVII